MKLREKNSLDYFYRLDKIAAWRLKQQKKYNEDKRNEPSREKV